MNPHEDQIRALANPMRGEILAKLKNPEIYFADQVSACPKAVGVSIKTLARHFHRSQPTMTRHIEILRRAGFVDLKYIDTWVYCRRNPRAIHRHLSWLEKEIT